MKYSPVADSTQGLSRNEKSQYVVVVKLISERLKMPRIGRTPRRRPPAQPAVGAIQPNPVESMRHRGLAGRIDDFLARLLLGLPGNSLVSQEDNYSPFYLRWLARLPDAIL